MKIQAEFSAKNNKLYKLSDGSEVSLESVVNADSPFDAGTKFEQGKIHCVNLPWKLVEPAPESYNEEFLAGLRDFLKNLEENSTYAIIVPETEPSATLSENFTAAMKHSARRIKDCKSVIGFAIPKAMCENAEKDGISAINNYIEELSVKHEHYVFFAKTDDIKGTELSEKIKDLPIVLY